MPRSRNIKPGFFENEHLGELDDSARLLFLALTTLADREGVIELRLKKILTYVWRYNRNMTEKELNRYLTVIEQLDNKGLLKIVKYEDISYIVIVNFEKHQHPHHTEKKGGLPTRSALLNEGVTVTQPLDNGYNPSDSCILIPDSCILNTDTVEEKPSTKKINKKSLSYFKELDLWNEETIITLQEKLGLSLGVDALNLKRDACIDYHQSKGTTVKDWVATFRTWLRNSKQFDVSANTEVTRISDLRKMSVEEQYQFLQSQKEQ
jgi:hypothetical protein